MKKITAQILLGLLVAGTARADTALTINGTTPYGCLQNAYIYPAPLQVASSFSLPGVGGTATLQSTVPASAPTFGYPPVAYLFNYSD